jgi:glycyl-tRNA synthetase beta chain
MVKEFPELQGVMGALYARQEGRSEAVCTALEQQYLGGGRERFASVEAAVLVVSDRLDTLVGFFLLGKTPTGSRDPFGLRRSASALVQATLDRKLSFRLDPLIGRAAALYRAQGIAADEEALSRLVPFLVERLRHAGQELHGFRYDAVNAAVAVGCQDLYDAFRRAEALNGIRGLPDFEALSLSYRRVKNILAGQSPVPLEEERLVTDEERALLRGLRDVEASAGPCLAAGDYASALRRMSTLRSPLDRFFEKVLVMDPDARTRGNRLALLERISSLFSQVGDLAEMVLEGEKTESLTKRG